MSCRICELRKKEIEVIKAQLEETTRRKGQRDEQNINLMAENATLKAHLKDLQRKLFRD